MQMQEVLPFLIHHTLHHCHVSTTALRYQALGGVYIAGGGVARKMLPRVLDGTVRSAYLDKGHSVEVCVV